MNHAGNTRVKPGSRERDSQSPEAVCRLIDVRGLRYRYPDGTQALDGVDFQLISGECVACSERMVPARPPSCCT